MTISVWNDRAALGLTWTELAAHYRDQATRCYTASRESFDRCDTDGFLSQWANDTSASEYRAAAELAESEGVHRFPALYDTDGNLLDARNVEGKYGWVWVHEDADGNAHWFNESRAKKAETRRANDARKGYRLGYVLQRAYVTLGGSGHSLYPIYRPADKGDTIPLDDDWYSTDY